MDTTIHLRTTREDGAATVRAVCTEHYTSIDLSEPSHGSEHCPQVVVFVDADSALAVAYAAVEAYQGLTGKGVTETLSDLAGVHNDRLIDSLTSTATKRGRCVGCGDDVTDVPASAEPQSIVCSECVGVTA